MSGTSTPKTPQRRGAASSTPPQNPLTKSQERIYSSQQLLTALKSSLSAVREQLQVLTILDGTAASWPGVQQATDDLEFLIDVAGHTTSRMEKDVKCVGSPTWDVWQARAPTVQP